MRYPWIENTIFYAFKYAEKYITLMEGNTPVELFFWRIVKILSRK